jgi:drug/metabolite transporter (DMT)-like permease
MSAEKRNPVTTPIFSDPEKNFELEVDPMLNGNANGNGVTRLPPEKVGLYQKYGGMLMAFMASVFFSTTFFIINVLVKSGETALGCAVLFNFSMLVICSLTILYNEKGPGAESRDRVFAEIWPLNSREKKIALLILIFVGSLQGISVICRSFALMFIPFGDMAVIVFSSPVVTTILAHFIVGEQLSCIFILIAVYTLFGVGLITKPPFITGSESYSTDTIIGSGLAIGALFSLSFIFATMRKIKQVHYLLMTAFLGGCGLLITLPIFLIKEDFSSLFPETMSNGLLLIGLLAAFFAITCNNIALQLENAGIVALVRSFDVIFAFLLQFIFLGQAPDIYSSIGGTIVVSAVAMSGAQKWWQDRKNNRNIIRYAPTPNATHNQERRVSLI